MTKPFLKCIGIVCHDLKLIDKSLGRFLGFIK